MQQASFKHSHKQHQLMCCCDANALPTLTAEATTIGVKSGHSTQIRPRSNHTAKTHQGIKGRKLRRSEGLCCKGTIVEPPVRTRGGFHVPQYLSNGMQCF